MDKEFHTKLIGWTNRRRKKLSPQAVMPVLLLLTLI